MVAYPTPEAGLEGVRERIARACDRAGRSSGEVRLVAVTKAVPVAAVREAAAAGVDEFGENYVREMEAKRRAVPEATWHFVGRLQRNKVRALAPWVSRWQSVDREPLGSAIATRAPGAAVLVEVNLAVEPQKGGCAPEAIPALVDALRDLELRVDGLMTVHPQHGEPRRWFAALRELGARLELPELSMGMTDDFEIAVEEGATIVRVGRALFGER